MLRFPLYFYILIAETNYPDKHDEELIHKKHKQF